MRAVVAAGALLLLLSGVLLPAGAPAAAPRPTAAECRQACEDRNVPASCAWLSPEPRRCLREAVRACRREGVPGAAQCPLPRDLPACGSHQGCPYGALCVDATCQVVGCGSEDGVARCTGERRCAGDKCVVADCRAVTANCPKGFRCQPADPPFDAVSGTCVPDTPGASYCSGTADCIEQGGFNPTCVRGVCTRQRRGLGRCEGDADCARRCRRGRSARPARCDAAGACLCPSCADDAECGRLLQCPEGRAAVCRASGACVCRRSRQPSTTTTTATTSTTTTSTLASGCADVFDCDTATEVCCDHRCTPNPYAGQSVCSTLYTPACTLCRTDDDCGCSPEFPIFCDSCGGEASIFSCVDPCG